MKSVNQIRMSAILMAAIFLFAGCEKEIDDTADNPPVAASINSAIIPLTDGPGSSGGSGTDGIPTTRAAGTAWAADDAIGITATHADGTTLLENAHYLTPGGDGTFTAADGSVFYFTDNAEVGFTAYYPWTAPEKLKNGIIQDVLTGATNQTPANQPKIDFLFATAKGSAASPDVRLQFRHCMSRLVLNFKPGEGIAALDDIEYWLSGIAVAGTFNPLTGEAKAEAINTPGIGIAINLTVPGNAAAELSSPLILFPQQGDDVRTLTLTMRGTTYTATFQLPQNPQNNNVREILAGHSYTYNVKINNTTMTISQATISDWSDGGSENIDSTN